MRILLPAVLASVLLLAGLAIAGDLTDRCRVSDLEIPAIASPEAPNETAPATVSGDTDRTPDYTGFLRVYMVEPESRYYDYNFYNYENGFLDFAVNQSISIPYQDSIVITKVWNGTTAGFSDITEDNIAAVAAVFNDTGHPANSDPDGLAPFTAYYGDACAYAEPGETASDTAIGDYSHMVLVEEGTAHG
ncbi:MAG: hypothetical protein R3F48_10870 [Candidatus Zixiibacteriota bacterium]